MLVGGFIFNAFGLASWFFQFDRSTSWGFWGIGTGLWLFALTILFFYLSGPQPKRGRHR